MMKCTCFFVVFLAVFQFAFAFNMKDRIRIISKTTLDVGCIGAAIGPNIIVTSANCVKSFQKDEIYVSFKDEHLKLQVRSARDIHVHPEFNPTTMDHDLTVISFNGEPKPEFYRHIDFDESFNNDCDGFYGSFNIETGFNPLRLPSFADISRSKMTCEVLGDLWSVMYKPGTPLACGGKLTGILSAISGKSQADCQNGKAYYTRFNEENETFLRDIMRQYDLVEDDNVYDNEV